MTHVILGAIIGGIICCIGWIGIYNLIYEKLISYDTTCLSLSTTGAIITALVCIAFFMGIEFQHIVTFIIIGGISTLATFYCTVAVSLQPFLFSKNWQSAFKRTYSKTASAQSWWLLLFLRSCYEKLYVFYKMNSCFDIYYQKMVDK